MNRDELRRGYLVMYVANGFIMHGRVVHIGMSKRCQEMAWIRRLSRSGKGLIDFVRVSAVQEVLRG